MEAVIAYYNGHTFVPMKPIKVKKNQRAIVTVLDDTIEDNRSTRKQSWLDFFAAIDAASNEELLEEPAPVRIQRSLDL